MDVYFLKSLWKQHGDLCMKICLGLLCIICMCGACQYCNRSLGLQDDHPLENLVEDLIEEEFGLPEDSIDFTK